MPRPRTYLTTAALVALIACACGGNSGHSEVSATKAKFSHPTSVDNAWFPLVPGTQFVYQGRAASGGQVLPHQLVFTVTALTKTIDGVQTRVLWDRDYDSGQLVEGELAFHAQDDAGNVWNFGEYPEEWNHGELKGAPDTWMDGIQHARAGIVMPAKPRPGTPSYLQGLAPTIDFDDRAQVNQAGLSPCVPAGCYHNVLVTKEWSAPEPGAFQFKYYAASVGNVQVTYSGTDKDRETLVLLKVMHLDPSALTQANEQALQIDQRGYTVSPKVYGQTSKATAGGNEPTSPGPGSPPPSTQTSIPNVPVSAACANAMKRYDDVIRANGSDADERAASEATLSSCMSTPEWLRAAVPFIGPGEEQIAADATAVADLLDHLCKNNTSPQPACQNRG